MPTRQRQIISGATQGRWQDMLREAERQLRSQAGGSYVSQEAIWNRAIQIGGVPPRSASQVGTAQRDRVVPGQRQAAGGTGGVTAPPDLQNLIEEYQDALDTANAANEERYNEILTGYQDLIGEVTGGFRAREQQFQDTIAGYGAGQEARINRQFDRLGASAQANLVGRGLTASTIAPSVQRGVEDERNMALLDLGDRLAGLRLSGQSQLSGDTLGALSSLTQNQFGFQERRTDQGPDFSQLAQLAQLFGQGNAGQGFNVQIPQASGGGLPSGGTVGVQAPLASPTGFQFSNLGAQLVGGAQQQAFMNQILPFLAGQGAFTQQGGGGAGVPFAFNFPAGGGGNAAGQQPQQQYFGPPLVGPQVNRGHSFDAGNTPVGYQGGGAQAPVQQRSTDVTRRYNNAYLRQYGRYPGAPVGRGH